MKNKRTQNKVFQSVPATFLSSLHSLPAIAALTHKVDLFFHGCESEKLFYFAYKMMNKFARSNVVNAMIALTEKKDEMLHAQMELD